MNTSFRAALALLTTIATLGCSTNGPTVEKSCVDDNGIREAVFRYQFSHNSSAAQQSVDVYFLSLAEKADPDEHLLARFAGHQPDVKAISQSRIVADGRVEEKNTGRSGLIFRIDSIHPLDEKRVRVKGGYYEANVSASGNNYFLECQDDKWTVVDAVGKWIS